jgi:hypothetical protein
MTSTPCKIEDFIAQSENYYAAYPRNGTFPFLTSQLAEDAPLRLAYPNFIDRVTEIAESYGSITLVNSSAEQREIVTSEGIISAESLCLTVTGEFTHYQQAVREIHTHVLTHMEGHDSTVEMINREQVQQHLISGPDICCVQGNVIVEHKLEEHLWRACSLYNGEIGRHFITAGLYNSIFYRERVVFGIYFKAETIHDWVALRDQLEAGLPSIVFVMFNTLTVAQGADNEMTFL